MPFHYDGEERQVDLRAPYAVRRGNRLLVQLIDLWVASGLPGDFLDMAFELVVYDTSSSALSVTTLDPQRFARGFVGPCDRELWWDDPSERTLNGLIAQSIGVRPSPSCASVCLCRTRRPRYVGSDP